MKICVNACQFVVKKDMKTYIAIGLMSGTAMDGIDAAAIETDGYDYIKPLVFVSQAHDPELRKQLQSC